MAGGFLTLEGRANTSPTALDALTLDNAESLGRDAVLALRATDSAGDVSWAHCRLTWGLPESVVAREWQPLQSDRLAYALMHPGPAASAVQEPVHTAAEARALRANAALMNYDPEVLASILRASEPAAEPFVHQEVQR